MYRITISTSEHGTILDQDVEGFILIRKILCEHNDPTHEPEGLVDVRGMNHFEYAGFLDWARDINTANWVDDAAEGPSMLDTPD